MSRPDRGYRGKKCTLPPGTKIPLDGVEEPKKAEREPKKGNGKRRRSKVN